MTLGFPAQAEEGTLEEIVVTAQRREETPQSAPIALSVASAEDLERAHVVNPDQLMTVIPALQAQNSGITSNFYIRGGRILGYQPLETGVESVAAFSRLTWELTPGVRLNGGVRYTRDKRYMDGVGCVLVVACAASAVPAGSINICPGGSAMIDGTPAISVSPGPVRGAAGTYCRHLERHRARRRLRG